MRFLARASFLLLAFAAAPLFAQTATPAPASQPAATVFQHPALILVGDSIMKTGANNGERGPWGWGYEMIPLFDANKIHVYNEGRGGRSSRGYIEEGAWAPIRDQLKPGDFVIMHFGHNDAANSANYPDRITLPGTGDDTKEIESPKTHEKETIHSYGWYLRQYASDVKAKGATMIICSPPPRNQWIDGKIKRGFDGYAQWAADSARAAGVLYIDLNALTADRFDALGKEATAKYFNDNQHTTKLGAQVNAQSVAKGLRQLKDCPLAADLLPEPPAAPK